MHGSKKRLLSSCGLVQWFKSVFPENFQILLSLILLRRFTPPLTNTKRPWVWAVIRMETGNFSKEFQQKGFRMGASSKRHAKANNIMSTSILTKESGMSVLVSRKNTLITRAESGKGQRDREKKGKGSQRRLLRGACSHVQYTVKNQTPYGENLNLYQLLFLLLSNAQIFHVFINIKYLAQNFRL